jgi:Na+/alanine symporter
MRLVVKLPAGGAFGQVVLMGFKRGIFSNEAGLGSAPIAHAAARTDDPVRQGTVAMLGTFIDTLGDLHDDSTRDHYQPSQYPAR